MKPRFWLIGVIVVFTFIGLSDCAPAPPVETPTAATLPPALTPTSVQPAPPRSTALRDLEYARYTLNGAEHPLALDLYLPEPGGEEQISLLIYIHGGGWMEGSKEDCPAEPFVQRGYAVACVDYRLASAPQGCPAALVFPAQIEDVKAAVRWLRVNAAQYGLDPERFGALGDSSGAHLAALLGVSSGVAALAGTENPAASAAVQAVVDWFGPVDVTQGPIVFEDDPCVTPWDALVQKYGGEETPYFYWTAAWGTFLGGSLADPVVRDRAAQASPLTYVDAGDPPFLIIHGAEDDMVPVEQGERLALALQDAGVEAEFIIVPGAGHGFGSPDGEVMPEFIEPTLAFFDQHLKGAVAPPAEGGMPQEPVAAVSGPQTFAVTIDGAATGEPISKYLYGGFIEHQGRCIYGGVWAEMLEDRKFYYPVNYYFPWGEEKNKSPWRANTFDTVVVMDAVNPYVGAHTPRVDLEGSKPRGVVQDGLGLAAGKEYTGYVILSASGAVSAEVHLAWGPGPDGQQVVSLGAVPETYTRFPFRFTAGAASDDGRLEIVGHGAGSLYVGAASLMPADNVEGMRADTLALLREIGFTVYRWPGGIFVNDYRWQEAVGERDERPPRLNHAYWSEMVESNDFGLDEFMTLCRLVDAEPYVVVSATGPGDAQMAAGEVEYLNGPAGDGLGALRAANGHPEPYNVKFWGVGNEMWDVPLEEYVGRHNEIAEAMYAVDPTIKLVAVGGVGFEGLPEGGDWAEGMLTRCAEDMALISEHVYGGSSPNLVEHAASIAEGIRWAVDAQRGYRERLDSLQGRDIRLALDEWNYFWGDRDEIYGEAGPRYYFKDALGVADGLHEMYRNSDIIFMANTHPVNVHGQVKTTRTGAAIEATGLVWELYRHHFGTLPLAVSGDVAPLDVAAAWTEDRQTLTIAVVNPTAYTHTLRLTLRNGQLSGAVRLWIIANSDPLAYNEPGQPARVAIEERQLDGISGELNVEPLSISLYELAGR